MNLWGPYFQRDRSAHILQGHHPEDQCKAADAVWTGSAETRDLPGGCPAGAAARERAGLLQVGQPSKRFVTESHSHSSTF